mmetsp:Transcript_16085/g.36033  ORF Transcript_16085/g.36033 Transcript_16085/m.36033 type:complete len:219 (-) Transcript_16085:232-888(-)
MKHESSVCLHSLYYQLYTHSRLQSSDLGTWNQECCPCRSRVILGSVVWLVECMDSSWPSPTLPTLPSIPSRSGFHPPPSETWGWGRRRRTRAAPTVAVVPIFPDSTPGLAPCGKTAWKPSRASASGITSGRSAWCCGECSCPGVEPPPPPPPPPPLQLSVSTAANPSTAPESCCLRAGSGVEASQPVCSVGAGSDGNAITSCSQPRPPGWSTSQSCST